MREKRMQLVITFQNTRAAMALEKACKVEGLRGRLIPVPLEISDACGLALLAETEDRDELEQLVNKHNIEIDNMIKMEL